MEVILASASPRRKELMKEISSSFLIEVADIDESHNYKISPKKYVKHTAFLKGEKVAKNHPNDITISADTIVVLNNEIIGKPKDEEDARRILKSLSGKKHIVYTCFYIFHPQKIVSKIVKTKVYFKDIDDDLINAYIESKSPLDKAGAYGIQDNDKFPIIQKIKGSLNNVIGFPVEEIKIVFDKLQK